MRDAWEIRGRYMRDAWEIRGRCRGEVGEMYRDVGEM